MSTAIADRIDPRAAGENPDMEQGSEHAGLIAPANARPGCYVCRETGSLVRIPGAGKVPTVHPSTGLPGSDRWVLTRISDNPFITLTRARLLAADLDIDISF